MKKYIFFVTLFVSVSLSNYGQISRNEFKDSLDSYTDRGEKRKALKLSKKFYSEYPTDSLSIIYYSNILESIDYINNKKKINKLNNELLLLDSSNFNFYNINGFYAALTEDYEQALKYADRSLSKKNNRDAYLIKALSYEALYDTSASNDNFHQAFEIDSSNAYLNYKYAYTMYYRNNYYRASEYFIRFIGIIAKKNQKNSFAFIPDLIISLWMIGKKDEAVSYWKIHSKNNEVHYDYRFSKNELTKEIKAYCEGKLRD